MRKKPVVSNAYTKASGNPQQSDHQEERLPTEEKESNHGADVKRNHGERSEPNYGLPKCSVVGEYSRHISTISLS